MQRPTPEQANPSQCRRVRMGTPMAQQQGHDGSGGSQCRQECVAVQFMRVGGMLVLHCCPPRDCDHESLQREYKLDRP